MKASLLLEHYARIVESPDAISHLRRFILDLAVRGKLVTQDSNDEPAPEMLKRIAKEQAGRVQAGGRKLQKSFPPVGSEPYPIPSTWQWVRLGELGTTQTGSTPPKNKPEYYGSDVPFIRPGDLYLTRVDYAGEGLSRAGADVSGRTAPEGSVLMVCIGTVGKCQIVDRSVSFNQQINTLTPFDALSSSYALVAMRSEYFQKSAWAASAKTTIAILNKGNWEKLPVPLPPLAEQHRIVAIVDELMGLCDRLDAARAARESVRDSLSAASLARLNAPDPETFQADASFALDALPALTARPDQIKALRQTILNLAVRGKLLQQDEGDEPASELLKRIAQEKARLFEVGELRRSMPLSEFADEERPFREPGGWIWTTLASITLITQGYAFSSGDYSEVDCDGPPLIKIGDIGSNSPEVYIKGDYDPAYIVRPGDLLLGLSGSIKCAVWRGPVALLNQRIARIRPASTDISNGWLFLIVNESLGKWRAETSKLTVQNIKSQQLNGAPVPLPPLAEQHRIVAKVDELMALCDRLEGSLTATAATRRRLLDALLQKALDPVPLDEAA